MSTQDILKTLSRTQLKGLSRQDLIELLLGEQKIRQQIEEQRALVTEEKILLEEKYVLIKTKLFGRSSEKSADKDTKAPRQKGENKKPRKDFSKNLPERYPNVDIKEEEIRLETPPTCSCCQGKMEDSGMTEDSEYLTVIPKKYQIVRQKRHKYRCGKCHGEVQTTPGIPRIAPGSSYGDEMILDVALSKYCDLIPVERYAMMASRQGVKGIPSNSLIGLTYFLAEFVRPAYARLPQEVKSSGVVRADETPHRMLEGHEKSKWYLWGFSSTKTCYFEFHETRSGDVAHEFLKNSSCRVLMSDVFSGYIKAVRVSNEYRVMNNLAKIIAAFCNAHARRKFDEARPSPEQIKEGVKDEAQFYIDLYKKIYEIEAQCQDKTCDEILKLRAEMVPYFKEMKERGEKQLLGISNKGAMATAINYLIKNFEGLTYFINDAEVPIDNNGQERLMRNPVIGRKTWYGTHSIKGANTGAVLFSLVESCKLNKVNPREYFKDLVEIIHSGGPPLTPWEYLQSKLSSEKVPTPGQQAK